MVRAALACLVFASFASCAPARAASISSVNHVWCGTYKGSPSGCSTTVALAAGLVGAAAGGGGTWTYCGGPVAWPVYKTTTDCNGALGMVTLSSASCPGTDVISGDLLTCALLADSVTASLAAEGVDSATVLYVYSWGMGVVLSMWAIGFMAGVAVKVINAL